MTLPTQPEQYVLIVEDERPLSKMIAAYLERAGFRVGQEFTGPDAVATARLTAPDVIILDLGLPGMDGLEVCQKIREFSDCYILMLTARGAEEDRITGLTTGADDYLSKPFSVRELVTRIHTLLRRPRARQAANETASTAIDPAHTVVEDLTIDTAAHQVWCAGREVALTKLEFDLLQALATKPGQVLSREELVETVWETDWIGEERVVDVHVGNVRRKLASHGSRATIATVRGVGYRMGQP